MGRKFRLILMLLLATGICILAAEDQRGLVTLQRCVLGEGFYLQEPGHVDFEKDFFGYKYPGNTSNLIDAEVYAFGAFERHILFVLRDLLKIYGSAETLQVLDVGANVGQHSLFLAQYARQVYAVEPYPPVLERMERLFAINNISNVQIRPVGYSDAPGNLPFFAPPDFNQGTGTFSAGQAGTQEVSQSLPLVTGDEDLKSAGAIQVIKIDIEGYEKLALAGLQKTLASNRPAVVMELNCNNPEGFHDRSELEAAFPANYVFYEIFQRPDYSWRLPGGYAVWCGVERGEYWLESFNNDFSRSSRNLLALPAERSASLQHAPE